MSTLCLTYLILAFTLKVFHSERLLMALNICGLHNPVVGTELALGPRVEQRHVLKGTATDQNTSLSGHWTCLGLNRVDCQTDFIILIDLLKL